MKRGSGGDSRDFSADKTARRPVQLSLIDMLELDPGHASRPEPAALPSPGKTPPDQPSRNRLAPDTASPGQAAEPRGTAADEAAIDLGAEGPGLMSESQFAERLRSMLDFPIRVSLTRNRSTLISVKSAGDGVVNVRVQHAFRAADRKTMKALAQFVRRPTPHARRVIDAFMRERSELLESQARAARAASPLRARGRHRDLNQALEKVLADHGLEAPGIVIGWSSFGRTGKKWRRTIKFGSFHHDTGEIRIHPELDDPSVPDYFVEYIVYHELLHALCPPRQGGGGRRLVHSPEFRREERKFIRYAEAKAFEAEFVRTRLG